MRLSLRLNLSLVAGVAIVSLGIALYETQAERSSLRRDLERQAMVVAESLEKSAAPLVATNSIRPLQNLVNRFENHQRLAGVAVYNDQGEPLAVTPDLAERIGRAPAPVAKNRWQAGGAGEFFRIDQRLMHVYELPMREGASMIGALAIYHDAGYIDTRQAAVWHHALTGLAVQTALIVGVTLLILQWSLRRPLAKLTHWLGEVRRGGGLESPDFPREDTFEPLKLEVTRLATSLSAARAAAEEEARLRDAGESLWTAERLRISVQTKVGNSRMFAISNREPYEHLRRNGAIECSVPASGLVTALEPILRATDGTWIAQGTGEIG